MARKLAYYSAPLSDNIEETPEGFLICRDVPIARTGWQQYKISELPKEMADAVGLDTSNPSAMVDLYRDARDVFDPDCLASFEGKAVTEEHPDDFVTPENFNKVAKGHVQNVRRGKEPFDSGDYPIIADLHIMAEPLLTKVRNKTLREVSCGYDYALKREGDKVLQADITGNHVAVVPKGRAGPEARINDSAPITAPVDTNATQTKERTPIKVSNIFKHLLGLGLKVYATDAEPEALADAMQAVKDAEPEPPAADKGKDKKAKDKKGAKDEETVVEDSATDHRKRMHDALDRMLDTRAKDEICPECGEEPCVCEEEESAVDADLSELKTLLDEFFTEEEEEPEHSEDDILPAGDSEEGEDSEEEEEEEEKEDEEEEEGVSDKKARAKDAADGALAVLKALRPIVARSKDEAVKNGFNAALTNIKGRSKASTASYGRFSSAARGRDKAPVKGKGRDNESVDPEVARAQRLQKFYNESLNGGSK